MIMDMLDGRVARLMKATSQFGVEYDWLADIVWFGVAPAFMLYWFALRVLGRPAWLAAFLFVICGALRLARFNVITGTADKRYFVGLPIPAGAAGACSVVILLQGADLTRRMRGTRALVPSLAALPLAPQFHSRTFPGFPRSH